MPLSIPRLEPRPRESEPGTLIGTLISAIIMGFPILLPRHSRAGVWERTTVTDSGNHHVTGDKTIHVTGLPELTPFPVPHHRPHSEPLTPNITVFKIWHDVMLVLVCIYLKGGGVVDKVMSVGSYRLPRVGSHPTTYRFEAMPFVKWFKLPTCHHDTQVLGGYTKDALGW
ncbi:hypothetical protein E2C01_005546 [Portunus trituberculatus]|uniref:Uncharacterized protein n=1 Tax=Portunus trituberculatus TaxID=210409 RepID=A0A5B7CVE2_PORTR|nr:hypothetical protein [Portunus trituberculatus]